MLFAKENHEVNKNNASGPYSLPALEHQALFAGRLIRQSFLGKPFGRSGRSFLTTIMRLLPLLLVGLSLGVLN